MGPTRIKRGPLGALALTLLVSAPTALLAQAPDEEWRTLATEHFRITFPEGLEELGRKAADRAEWSYERLETHFIEAPEDPIDVLVTDHADISNGYAIVNPSNRIVVFARPPVDVLALGFSDEWLELVILHELAHILHLDHVVNPIGRLGRTIFGRVPAEWPFFPELGTPGWVIEGIATWYESRLTQAGRTLGSFHDMQLRTAALEDRFESIGQAGSRSPVWPGGNRPYVYGSLFFDYLLERHGEEKMEAFVDAIAGQWIPYRLDAAGEDAFGVSLSDEWDAWRASVGDDLDDFDAGLRRLGPITEPEALTSGSRWAFHPEVSPDGRHVAYARSDGHSDIQLHVIDLETGESSSVGRTNRLATFSWIDAERLLVSQVELRDPYRYYNDLYVFDVSGSTRRLTDGARLTQPSVAADGSWAVAVQEGGGTNGLVTVDVGSGEISSLVEPRPDVHWAFPRLSPDDRWIAVTRFEPNARHDVVILDARNGAQVARVTEDRAIDLAPRWSPDGDWLVWGSDRSAVFNVWGAPVAADGSGSDRLPGADAGSDPVSVGEPVMLTNVRTGVAYPSLDPAGEWLYVSGYHADGWEVERVPFEPEDPPRTPPLADRFVPDGPFPDRGSVEGEVEEYASGPTLRPTFWEVSYQDAVRTPPTPVDVEGETVSLPGREILGPAVGFQTEGRDLVSRHAYNLFLRLTTSGPTKLDGGFGYAFFGLGSPVLSLSATQTYEDGGQTVFTEADDPSRDTLFVLQRERFVRAAATFRAPTWRWGRSVTVAGGFVWENRELLGTDLEPVDGIRLIRPSTRLLDGSISFSLNSTRSHSFQMGTSEGLGLSVQGRVRRELAVPDSRRSVAGRDRSAADVTGTVRGAIPLWRAGYARHLVAFRASGGAAFGPGAGPTFYRVGGATGRPEPITGLDLFGGSFHFFPVRGYEPSSRFGHFAWSASAEYRIPIWMVHRGLGAWPVHLDRLMGAVFFDAGNAWGPSEWRLSDDTIFQNPLREPVASTGAELTAEWLTFFDIEVRIRGGVAFPLVAATVPAGEPRFYVRVGLPY